MILSPDPPPWGAIITAVVLTTVGALLLFIFVYKFSCHCNDLWARHKDIADLDKLPVYPLTEIKGGLNKDYGGSDPLHLGGMVEEEEDIDETTPRTPCRWIRSSFFGVQLF